MLVACRRPPPPMTEVSGFKCEEPWIKPCEGIGGRRMTWRWPQQGVALTELLKKEVVLLARDLTARAIYV